MKDNFFVNAKIKDGKLHFPIHLKKLNFKLKEKQVYALQKIIQNTVSLLVSVISQN